MYDGAIGARSMQKPATWAAIRWELAQATISGCQTPSGGTDRIATASIQDQCGLSRQCLQDAIVVCRETWIPYIIRAAEDQLAQQKIRPPTRIYFDFGRAAVSIRRTASVLTELESLIVLLCKRGFEVHISFRVRVPHMIVLEFFVNDKLNTLAAIDRCCEPMISEEEKEWVESVKSEVEEWFW